MGSTKKIQWKALKSMFEIKSNGNNWWSEIEINQYWAGEENTLENITWVE